MKYPCTVVDDSSAWCNVWNAHVTISLHETFSSSLLRNKVQACDGNFSAQKAFTVIPFSQKNNYYVVCYTFIYKCMSPTAPHIIHIARYVLAICLASLFCSSLLKVYLGRLLFTSSVIKMLVIIAD